MRAHPFGDLLRAIALRRPGLCPEVSQAEEVAHQCPPTHTMFTALIADASPPGAKAILGVEERAPGAHTDDRPSATST